MRLRPSRASASSRRVVLAGMCTARELRARAALVIGSVAVLAALVFGGCSDEKAARHTLEAEGYTRIEIMGFSIGCAEDDDTCTAFRAIGPSGRSVDGVVGCGILFKSCTVRIK